MSASQTPAPSSVDASIMTSQKVIIALIALCAVLLCVVIFLVVWRRRPRRSSVGDAAGREDAEVATADNRSWATPPPHCPSASVLGRTARKDHEADQTPANNDGSVQMVGPERRPVSMTRPRSGSRILSSAWERTLKLGGSATAVDRPQSAVTRPSSAVGRPPDTPRTVSFPAALPSPRYPPSPEASSFAQDTSSHPLLPNASQTYHPRVDGSPPRRPSPPLPSAHSSNRESYPPGPAIEVDPGSPNIVAALPPSPPPSPEPMHPETEFGMFQQQQHRRSSVSRPSTAGNHSASTHRSELRPGTAVSSSSAPSVSTLSGSSGRFSSLFFAPLAASPPHHSVIVEDHADFGDGRLGPSGL